MRAIALRLLLDSDRVHVSAKENGAVPPAAFQCSDDTGSADLLRDIIEAEGTKAIRDKRARPMLFEAELRMAMKVLSPGSELRPKSVIA
jgi:hypothetical protein